VEIMELAGNTTKNTNETSTELVELVELVDFLRNVKRLTANEIADELNMSKSSVRVFCSKNKIKHRNDHVKFISEILKYDTETNCTTSLDKLAKRFKISRKFMAEIVPLRKKRGSALLNSSERFRTFAERNTLTNTVREFKVSQKTVVDFCKSKGIEINKINKDNKKKTS